MTRDDLLAEKDVLKKDPQVIFVSNYHDSLKNLPAILKKHYHVLQNDSKLTKLFSKPPIVAYRRAKGINFRE